MASTSSATIAFILPGPLCCPPPSSASPTPSLWLHSGASLSIGLWALHQKQAGDFPSVTNSALVLDRSLQRQSTSMQLNKLFTYYQMTFVGVLHIISGSCSRQAVSSATQPVLSKQYSDCPDCCHLVCLANRLLAQARALCSRY